MPKTKDAFAFADFDAARILQRPYFRQFGFADVTDEKILSDLAVTDSDELAEKSLNDLFKLSKELRKYHKIGMNHLSRLTKYLFAVQDAIITRKNAAVADLQARFRRANEILSRYPFGTFTSDVDGLHIYVRRSDYPRNLERDPVDDLLIKVDAKIKEIDGAIKSRYRYRFAARLQQSRKAACMTRERLATLLRLTPRTVASYENAEREPSLATLAQISNVLNVKIDWLLK